MALACGWGGKVAEKSSGGADRIAELKAEAAEAARAKAEAEARYAKAEATQARAEAAAARMAQAEADRKHREAETALAEADRKREKAVEEAIARAATKAALNTFQEGQEYTLPNMIGDNYPSP
jgi:hypothetical protein